MATGEGKDMDHPFLFLLILLPALGRLCYTDIKWRELEHLFIFIILLCAFLWEAAPLNRLLGAILPFILYPFLGFGDILLLSVLGTVFGADALLIIFSYASVSAGILCALGLIFKKIKKEDELPFAPYISFGCLCYLLEHFL